MSVIIRLQNLPLTAGPSDVRAFFTGLKIPDGAVHIIGGPEGDVFIGFASDEDARQAMRRDRMNIHEAEVRLFLSSKTEMTNVINEAKSGFLTTPEPKVEEPPKPSWQQPAEVSANPFAARSGYSSSYPVVQQSTYNRSPPYSRPMSNAERRERHELKRIDSYQAEKPAYKRYSNEEQKPPRKPVPPFTTMPPTVRPFDQKVNRVKDFGEKVKSDSWRGPSFPTAPSVNGQIQGGNRIEENLSFGLGKKTLLGNGGPPPLGVTNHNLPPMTSAEKFYVELTRLPNDLHRPAELENFIRPSVPLTLSSAKVVFSREGVHVHTLVRLECVEDFETLLKRDGEMGIRIRKTSENEFETAVEGIPVAPIVATSLEIERQRRRSRSPAAKRKRSPTRKRRSRSPEDRRRNRSPPTRRRRHMSSRYENRKEHKDPTRWCIQITNVPFRCKDEELLQWFAEKVKPAKLTRTYYADGNASDRWIAEFSSESLMERAFSIKSLCQGRTLRMQYIENETADELLKIEDRYGNEKRQLNEELREQVDKAIPTSFFNAPRPPPITAGSEEESMVNASTSRHAAPRGGFVASARGRYAMPLPPFSRAMLSMPPSSGMFFPSVPAGKPDMPRGRFRGRFRGRGTPMMAPRGRGVFFNNHRMAPQFPNSAMNGEELENHTSDTVGELISALGPPGTVLSCSGFPNDVTLEDVVNFFQHFAPDPNSVRIRRDETGIITGECLLACSSSENAERASRELDGKLLRDCQIHVEPA